MSLAEDNLRAATEVLRQARGLLHAAAMQAFDVWASEILHEMRELEKLNSRIADILNGMADPMR